MPNFPIPFATLRRALVIKLGHHGDVLLASPVLSALKRAAPHCEVDALTYADTVSMFADHPALSRNFTVDRNWKRLGLAGQTTAEWQLLVALRARRYDLVVHLSVHRRGSWLVRLLRPRWSVAPNYTGTFWTKSFTFFYDRFYPHRHTVASNLEALRVLGHEPTDNDKRVILIPGAEAEARIDALLDEAGLTTRSFIHVHPASRWFFKCWPMERFAALCDALAERGWPVVLTAAPDKKEQALIAQVRAVVRTPLIDFSGRVSLKELAALTSRAKLFVGVDSAPMHIAAAMRTPTVAIFGPSGDREWGPWNVANRVVVSATHDCRPCGRDGCDGSKISECLTTLPVDQVLAACVELIDETKSANGQT